MKAVLASSNAGKVREFAALLAARNIEVIPQSAFGIVAPEETGTTFLDNALLKARHAATVSGLPALADDSGIEVDGLQGRPGVRSARYAGELASDADNTRLLLMEVAGVPDEQRTARYRVRAGVLIARPIPNPLVTEGVGGPRAQRAAGDRRLRLRPRVSTGRFCSLSRRIARGSEESPQPPRAGAACLAGRAQMMLETPPLSLYLHFPWCVRKCPYCDFNSYTLSGELPEAAYLAALSRDMREQAALPAVAGRPLTSVFMGGGTPSLFSPAAIGRVLDEARALFGFAPQVEITLEANPGTIERGRFAEYAAIGVNRVSLGAQSFGARQLQVLGRIHSVADTARGAEELHAAGLSNFNLDLMYGLPEQDVAGARSDLRQALALAPAHISHYHLTMEPGTVFGAQPPPLPTEDSVELMLAACADEELDGAGLRALRGVGLCASRASVPPQPQLLGFR